MADFKVGDKVRLTGDRYPDRIRGEAVRIIERHWSAGWVGLHAASNRYWTVGLPGYTGVVVERDGRVIPEALLPGDVVETYFGERVTVSEVRDRGVVVQEVRRRVQFMLPHAPASWGAFVRPATPKPAEEIVVHRNGAVIGAPRYGEAVSEVLGRMSDDAKERMALGRATRSVYDEARALLTAVPDYDSPLATTITVEDVPPPRCAECFDFGTIMHESLAAGCYEQHEEPCPACSGPKRATSIADAALRGLPYEVDMREEYAEAKAWAMRETRHVEWRMIDPARFDTPQLSQAWSEARAAELRESLESEARRTLREWPTRAGVPLRLAVRGDAGLFTATWEE